MSLMKQQVMIGYALEAVAKCSGKSNHEIFDYMSQLAHFSEDDLAETYAKTGENILFNRFQFCLNDLRMAGVIDRDRGSSSITDSGSHLLDVHDYLSITLDVLKKLPAYQQSVDQIKERQRLKKKTKKMADVSSNNKSNQLDSEAQNKAFLEKISLFVKQYNNNVKKQLLSKLQLMNPYDLEHVIADLLTTMGYASINGNATVTQRSNDGGIDGILNMDPLGVSRVYFQVKRYADTHVVDRPQMQAFYGALHATYHASRGIFITTSRFTPTAKDLAQSSQIILIDGQRLVQLMIDYDVMIKKTKTFELYGFK